MKLFMSFFVLKSERKTLKFNFKSAGILIIYISDQEEGGGFFAKCAGVFFFFAHVSHNFRNKLKKTCIKFIIFNVKYIQNV